MLAHDVANGGPPAARSTAGLFPVLLSSAARLTMCAGPPKRRAEIDFWSSTRSSDVEYCRRARRGACVGPGRERTVRICRPDLQDLRTGRPASRAAAGPAVGESAGG